LSDAEGAYEDGYGSRRRPALPGGSVRQAAKNMPTLLVPLNELLFATTDGARAQGPRTGAIVASWSKSATADLRATKRRIDRLTDIEKGRPARPRCPIQRKSLFDAISSNRGVMLRKFGRTKPAG